MRSPLIVAIASSLAVAQVPSPDHASPDYEKQVLPVLRTNCFPCHSGKNVMSGLALDSREGLLQGGNRGSAIEPATGILVNAVQQSGDVKMPPGRKLKPDQIEIIAAWVKAGASMPAHLLKAKRIGADHWAFQEVRRVEPSAVQNEAWVRNPIDRFILAKLEAAALKPSPAASKATLLRRVSLDLTGLPPNPEEIDAFLADSRPDAYERAVDRLLASPHYGERQARHWLDLARYSDTDGYTIDAPREIWKYRDWVIDALNRDMPFDRFTIEQIAGDLLPNPTIGQRIASGFHRNTPSNFEGGIDFEQYRVEAVADRVQTTGAVWMGLTLGCARCHDHKFDPITQKEFFQLFAFFNQADEVDREEDRKDFNKPFLELPTPAEVARTDAWNAQHKLLQQEIDSYSKGLTDDQKKTDEGFKEREANLRALERRKPKVASTLVMRDLKGKVRDSYIHIGGEFTRKGTPVQPGVPAVLPSLSQAQSRLDLAQWLVDRKNPLTARVTVNRLWQRYFGKGFVDTENDFGLQGDRPTHPELLDWLASEFMDRGWSQKQLHRLLVTSATYRQASIFREDAAKVDPENRLLHRQSRLRLDAETIRDAELVASGLLSRKVGGPSVYPPIPTGATKVTQVDREWKTSTGEDRYRRGLYTFSQRSALHPSLSVFDAPDGVVTCTRRIRSNTPLQALNLMNDEASVEFAQAFAKRLQESGLEQGFRLALGRSPTPVESDRLKTFLAQKQDWFAAARALLNLDEFMTRE
jgi:hypothetical protein